MSYSRNVIEEVRFVLVGGDGFQPGSFSEALILAFSKADAFNFARLQAAFPDYGEAVQAASRGGSEALDTLVELWAEN